LFSAPRFCRSGCPGKRLQKYNLFLISQAFLKKFLSLFLPQLISLNLAMISPSSQLGWQRYYLLPLSNKLFFTYFFLAFLSFKLFALLQIACCQFFSLVPIS